MNDDTPLDLAHDAMEAGGEPERMRFYERLADAELYLLLDRDEPTAIVPRVFPVEGEDVVLVFDRVERLADFAGKVTPCATLPGRRVVALLAGRSVGLGLNLGVARSSFLMTAAAVDWLAEMTAQSPILAQGRPSELRSPKSISRSVLSGLDAKLALAVGLARYACLVGVTYENGRSGHLLAFVDAVEGAEDALSRAVSESLVFSGVDAAEIDVAFFKGANPICARLTRVGLRFDLPEAPTPAAAPSAPGMDPDRPPKLR